MRKTLDFGSSSYTENIDPAYPDGLTTNSGEIVSFMVAATLPTITESDAGEQKE